jgi:hypothetical protein
MSYDGSILISSGHLTEASAPLFMAYFRKCVTVTLIALHEIINVD